MQHVLFFLFFSIYFFYFQIEKIMSSIGEGIDFSQEQQRISGSVPGSRVSLLVVLRTKRRCRLLPAELPTLLRLPEGKGKLWHSRSGPRLPSATLGTAISRFNSILASVD